MNIGDSFLGVILLDMVRHKQISADEVAEYAEQRWGVPKNFTKKFILEKLFEDDKMSI